MEESNTTSQYVYEDEFSFLTDKNELILKESSHFSKRKLVEVEEDDLESTLDELKEAFSKLEQEVLQLENEDDPDQDLIADLKDSLENRQALGDFDDLYNRLNAIQAPAKDEKTGKDEKPETGSVPVADADEGSESDEASEEAEAVEKDQELEETASTSEDEESTVSEESEEQKEDSEDSIDYYKNILEKADSLSKQDDWPYVTMELDNLSRKWGEGPDLDTEEVGKLYQKFTSKVDEFQERKKEHYEKLNKQKKE